MTTSWRDDGVHVDQDLVELEYCPLDGGSAHCARIIPSDEPDAMMCHLDLGLKFYGVDADTSRE